MIGPPPPRPKAAPMRVLTASLLAACGLASAGCGAESYSRDYSDSTIPYLTLQRDLNTNLSGPSAFRGITLRAPTSFSELDPPPARRRRRS